MDAAKVRSDFDEIARLSDPHDEDTGRYDAFLLTLIPENAKTVLDVGCGAGRLTAQIATRNREVVGIDLSTEMITRARQKARDGLSFICDDFLTHDFPSDKLDCVITAAALHHFPIDEAFTRLLRLLAPGGRLIIHDMRDDSGILDHFRSRFALAQVGVERLLRTGNPWRPRAVRAAWERHCAGETYLTLAEARAMANRLMPGAQIHNHWLWRYTVVWDKRV
ncbi:MAG TPA: class I SAM-dependent methyltransferase [Pyrinomonadaceae bacterium]|nr:class I SAM-dependent methyltransferase [Pyrinomonadaceae bacterium]